MSLTITNCTIEGGVYISGVNPPPNYANWANISTYTYSSNVTVPDISVNGMSKFKFSNDGLTAYAYDFSTNLKQYQLSTAYDISTITGNSGTFVPTQGTSLWTSFAFNSDETVMYVLYRNTPAKIYQYTLSDPGNISTATYASISYTTGAASSMYDIFVGNSDQTVYIGGSGFILQYNLATANDISTVNYSTSIGITSVDATGTVAIGVRPDGKELTWLGTASRKLYRYTLTTDWSIASSVNTNANLTPTAYLTSPGGFQITTDGTTQDGTFLFVSNSKIVTKWTG